MPPFSFSDALRAVFKVKGAVGYVFRGDYKPGVVKIIMVLPAQ